VSTTEDLLNLINKDKKKSDATTVYLGDDITMGSVAPYGIPSGIPQFDLYGGRRGGIPAGKVVEFYGFEMVGKTTAALQAGAEWQKRGGQVFFIDTEQTYSPRRAQELGCNAAGIIKFEAGTIEEVFDNMKTIFRALGEAKTEDPVLIIIDSITGVPTLADKEGKLDASDRPGFESKQIKRGLKQLVDQLGEMPSKPTIIFINHAYETFNTYGKKSKSGGGHGLKFFASVRVSFTHKGMLKDGEVRKGQTIKIEIEKLKGAVLEYPVFEAELKNECGFDHFESLESVMVATNYASKPKSSQTITFNLTDEQIKSTDFKVWCEENGGYDAQYNAWRKWAIDQGILQPWGGAEK
jgi:RecA/RadA recombinase